MPVVQVGTDQIHYDQSTPDNTTPALIPIHGSGGSSAHWPPALRHLTSLTVITPDLPGHGRSSGRGQTSVAAYADFIAAFVAALDLRHVVLMGHSLGGAIALETALRSPDWLTGLILVGTGARLRVNPAILDGMLRDREHTIDFLCERLFGPGVSGSLADQVRADFLRTDPRVIHGDFSACDQFDVMDRLPGITVPTRVISATHDQLTPPKYGAYLCAHIPQATHTLIQGAGHMLAQEKTADFVNATTRFLRFILDK